MHPPRLCTWWPAVAIVMLVVAAGRPARAVVIQTLSGTDNTTAPIDDPGFANVGYSTSGLGTAIYVGGGWVLTAGHVAGDGIVLASGTYLQASGSNTSFALVNTTPGKTATTDLYMFKLATEPAGLPTLPIASALPEIGAPVVMIGGGRDRGAFLQWSVNDGTDPWIWTPVESGGDAAGFGTLGSRAIRWGTNTIEAHDIWVNDGLDVKSLVTDFDYAPGTSEAQAVLNDSGGAVFTKTGGQWQLAGVIFAVDGYSGQPNPVTTAVFGDVTFIADLSYYGPQITAVVVPEPTAVVLAGTAGLCLVCGAVARIRRRGSRSSIVR